MFVLIVLKDALNVIKMLLLVLNVLIISFMKNVIIVINFYVRNVVENVIFVMMIIVIWDINVKVVGKSIIIVLNVLI
jgi:hypothetical protein